MKLLSSILLASANVMADEMMEPSESESNEVDEYTSAVHNSTVTPYAVHNSTMIHTTQSTILHLTTGEPYIGNITHDHFSPTPPPNIDNECEDTQCGCNAEEMARWEIAMGEWKYDQNIWKMEFNKWINEYGSEDEIHDWEHHNKHGTEPNADIGWEIVKILTQLGQICPFIDVLSEIGLDLGNLNLQEECEFQATELAGLAEVLMNLSSSSVEDWSRKLCEYLATMITEELTRYGWTGPIPLVPDSAVQTCSCLVNILMLGPMEVDPTAIALCASDAFNVINSFTGSS